MAHPEPPEDQASAAEEEVDEVVDPPQESNGSGDGEKPQGQYGG